MLLDSIVTGGSGKDYALSLIGMILSGSALFVTWRCLNRLAVRYSTSRLFKPTLPSENLLLPDQELLVRASSSSAAQPAELLRTATEIADEKSEELLRAGSK
jgi:hypothetical protein